MGNKPRNWIPAKPTPAPLMSKQAIPSLSTLTGNREPAACRAALRSSTQLAGQVASVARTVETRAIADLVSCLNTGQVPARAIMSEATTHFEKLQAHTLSEMAETMVTFGMSWMVMPGPPYGRGKPME
jgi:hypothetical protein